MTIRIDFRLDTRNDTQKISIVSPFSDLDATRDNLQELLENTAKSKTAIMPVRDADTGDYIGINTMKLAVYNVYEVEEE